MIRISAIEPPAETLPISQFPHRRESVSGQSVHQSGIAQGCRFPWGRVYLSRYTLLSVQRPKSAARERTFAKIPLDGIKTLNAPVLQQDAQRTVRCNRLLARIPSRWIEFRSNATTSSGRSSDLSRFSVTGRSDVFVMLEKRDFHGWLLLRYNMKSEGQEIRYEKSP